MRIYTKTGDKGQTSLIGGTRLSKAHERIDAYGTVDELNSWIGVLRDQACNEGRKAILVEIQDRLFTIGSLLASDPNKQVMQLPELTEGDVEILEKEMDAMDATLPEMRNFVLPGGHSSVSFCHVARTVCRRAERGVISLAAHEQVPELIIRYLNRLSDYLFVLARKNTLETGAEEVPWLPKK